MVACAALAWWAFREVLPVAAAVVLYGLAPASMYRSVPSLAHEDFALPLLFGGLAGLLMSLRGDTASARLLGAVVAAMLWTLALLTWHFARFFLIAQAVILLVVLVVASDPTRRRLRDAMAVIVATMIRRGCVLRTSSTPPDILLSLPFWLLASVLATATVLAWMPLGERPERLRRHGLAALVAAAVSGLCLVVPILGGARPSYGHVWALLWAKLFYWEGKPGDPSLLPFDARVLWTGSFEAPEPALFAYQMWAPSWPPHSR